MKRYFVTGTDTGVGKTTASRALLAAARRRGMRCCAFKPIESGCDVDASGALVADDERALHRAAATPDIEQPATVYRLRQPLSPHLAAAIDHTVIDLDAIYQRVRAIDTAGVDLLLVEGAGGLLVPINDNQLIADLAVALHFDVIIVARDGLGTINHTLLTVEAARSRGLTVSAVVLCSSDDRTSPLDARRNAESIASRCGVRVYGPLPYLPTASDDQLARAAEDALPLDILLRD